MALYTPYPWFGFAADIATFIGVVVALSGFYIAIRQISKLRRETQIATDAATTIRRGYARLMSLPLCSQLSDKVTAVKELLRSNDWQGALTSISELQRGLIQIQGRCEDQLSEDLSLEWKVSLADVDWLDNQISAISNGTKPADPEVLDKLNETLTGIQKILGQTEVQLEQRSQEINNEQR